MQKQFIEHSKNAISEITTKCARFIGPLRIPKRKTPRNYEYMLKILQSYSSFDLKTNWIRLITEQFNGKFDEIQFENDQLMNTYISSPKIRWMFFSMLFTILTMIFIYFMLSMSKNRTWQMSKILKFRKYYLVYTFIPVYCCFMTISLNITFGKEATNAGFAIRNAEKWMDIALKRNNYSRNVISMEVDCSIILPKMNQNQSAGIEKRVFRITSVEITKVLLENGEKPMLTPKLISFLTPAMRFYIKKLNDDMFDEVDRVVRRTLDLLRIPSEYLIDSAKFMIFAVSTVSICFTSFICLMVFLDLQNKYPKIVTFIQLFSPLLLLFIIIGYFFIWYIFTSIVGSYTIYSQLVHPQIHEHIKFDRDVDVEYFKKVVAFDMMQFVSKEVMGKIVKKYGNSCSNHTVCKYFEKCLNKTCKKSVYELTRKMGDCVDVWPIADRDFQIQSKNYLRYLSFFKQNTFVPIASLVWKILPLPFLIFFNLIFIHFATPLIRAKNEDASSDGLM
ncbi:unnamed protein product [Caenorhabditis angaria]|uniref:Uncharacterized protein n=1 Tax=Caenorhabditis angaria TaxID=860376 RepID=A0A9P1N6Y7_9PELO|nr:unnamed protein product [Caenorhabditis angaria]